MNTIQIKCFLTVAETLSFTKAANLLYISQPGLSKQIRSMERELNVLLFIRDNQKVRLTPAAAYLVKELSEINDKLDDVVENARRIGQGYSGNLCIGTLSGQWIGEDFTDYFIKFINENPNINVSLKQGSFGELRKWLDSGEIDIALTLPFDIKNMDGIIWKKYMDDTAVFVVSKKLIDGKKKKYSFKDLLNIPFISVSQEDSPEAYKVNQAFLNKQNFEGQIITAPNLHTSMLLVEAGQGFGIINHRASIINNPSIKVLEEIPLLNNETPSCFAWKKSNVNPAIAMFLNDEL